MTRNKKITGAQRQRYLCVDVIFRGKVRKQRKRVFKPGDKRSFSKWLENWRMIQQITDVKMGLLASIKGKGGTESVAPTTLRKKRERLEE